MSPETEVLAADAEFFEALLRRSREQLDALLGPDFVLIDVVSGSEIPRVVFVDMVGSGQLVFDSIERVEARLRHYGRSVVVTGATRMSGRFGEHGFHAHSRYTHVFVQDPDRWRLVSAQGTPIAPAPVPPTSQP